MRIARTVLFAGSLALTLPGCVIQVVQPGPGGTGTDSCQVQSVAFLDLTRGLQPASAIPPGRWADGGPAVQADLRTQLGAENALLERLQIAFDALLYCRWIELRTIRADLAAGRVPRATAEARLAAGRSRLGEELQRAGATASQLQDRGRGLDRDVERAAPGTAAALAAQRAGRDAPLSAVAAATVPLRLRPDPSAPEVGRIAAGRGVSLRPAAGGFARIEAPDGLVGYAPAGAFNLAARAGAPPAAPAARGSAAELRTLAATNLARRENFLESVEVSGRSIAAGFEEAL